MRTSLLTVSALLQQEVTEEPHGPVPDTTKFMDQFGLEETLKITPFQALPWAETPSH